MAFRFDRQLLIELAAANRERYAAARPFPHITLDGLFPEPVLDAVLEEFPSLEEEKWLRFDSGNERKLASRDHALMGDQTRELLAELNSGTFIDFLSTMTGIAGLVPDPYFEGGGLHQIPRGGHLNIHVDFNRDPRTGLDRRLNVLLYLNRDWREDYGGALELWSRDMTRCEERILPTFNRLVVFSTAEHSYHGHPTPLNCPEGRARRSLALYYYSNGRPEEDGSAADLHSTVWAQPRDRRAVMRDRVRHGVRQLAPPILVDAARAARRRART